MKRKKMLLILSIMLVLTIVVGISYSFFSARITKINETKTDLKTNELGLIYTGLGEIDYESMIPGDSFEKTFQVENISNRTVSYNIYMENITNELNEDLVYVLYETNSSGEVIKTVKRETPLPVTGNSKSYLLKNIEIEHDSFKYYKLTIEYKYQETSQNAYQGARFIATLGIDSNPIKDKICKRAGSSTLHTEICNYSSGFCAERRGNGATITYGNILTEAGELNAGDAFDCDVMGDGTYKYEGLPARFYYVSTADNGDSTGTDANTAVLIYYTNVENGQNSTNGAYWATRTDTGLSYTSNVKGPVTAINNLPGNAAVTWPGVTLITKNRSITDENGNDAISFSYGNATSRLLTYQELYNGCYDGSTAITSSDGLYPKCEFLFENTRYTDGSKATYGPWLETKYSRYSNAIWGLFSQNRNVNYDVVDSNVYGVRPVIEVPLTEISY